MLFRVDDQQRVGQGRDQEAVSRGQSQQSAEPCCTEAAVRNIQGWSYVIPLECRDALAIRIEPGDLSSYSKPPRHTPSRRQCPLPRPRTAKPTKQLLPLSLTPSASTQTRPCAFGHGGADQELRVRARKVQDATRGRMVSQPLPFRVRRSPRRIHRIVDGEFVDQIDLVPSQHAGGVVPGRNQRPLDLIIAMRHQRSFCHGRPLHPNRRYSRPPGNHVSAIRLRTRLPLESSMATVTNDSLSRWNVMGMPRGRASV